MRYLLCADGSQVSKNALDLLGKVFTKGRDELVILTVGGYEEHFWEDSATRENHQQKVAAHAQSIVDEYVKLAIEKGFDNVSGTIATGNVRDLIVQYASSNEIDMIAMGATGMGLGAVAKLLVGSVSDYVMKHTTLPILLAK